MWMEFDDDEFEAFYRRNYALVQKFFCRARVADDKAHDLAQEVFTKVWKSWPTYRRAAVRSFLETIARRVLLDDIRKRETDRRRGKGVPLDDPALAPELFELPRDIEDTLRRELLRELVSRLPPITKECVEQRIDGWSYEDIAAAMRISVDAVRTRLRDAKRMMKEDYDGQHS